MGECSARRTPSSTDPAGWPSLHAPSVKRVTRFLIGRLPIELRRDSAATHVNLGDGWFPKPHQQREERLVAGQIRIAGSDAMAQRGLQCRGTGRVDDDEIGLFADVEVAKAALHVDAP